MIFSAKIKQTAAITSDVSFNKEKKCLKHLPEVSKATPDLYKAKTQRHYFTMTSSFACLATMNTVVKANPQKCFIAFLSQ